MQNNTGRDKPRPANEGSHADASTQPPNNNKVNTKPVITVLFVLFDEFCIRLAFCIMRRLAGGNVTITV